MKPSWKSLLAILLLAEALLLLIFVRIQPNCEPCLPGAPCGPCISDDQRKLVMIMVLLPFGAPLLWFLARWLQRKATST